MVLSYTMVTSNTPKELLILRFNTQRVKLQFLKNFDLHKNPIFASSYGEQFFFAFVSQFLGSWHFVFWHFIGKITIQRIRKRKTISLTEQ